MEIQVQYPRQVNLFYYTQLSRYLKLFQTEINKEILPILKKQEDIYAVADSVEGLLSTIYRLIEYIGTLFQSVEVQNIAKAFVNRMAQHQVKNGLLGQIQKIDMSRLLNTFRINEDFERALVTNKDLIVTIPKNYLKDVKELVSESFKQGKSYKTIATELQSIYKQQSWKMERIARTETSKLNTDVNVAQAKSLGFDSFIWVTAGDERTCKVCAPLNGKVMRFDGGILPGHVHPNDRCTMKFIIN